MLNTLHRLGILVATLGVPLMVFGGIYGKYCQTTTVTTMQPNPCTPAGRSCGKNVDTSGSCVFLGLYCPTPGTGTQKIYLGTCCSECGGCSTSSTPNNILFYDCEC